MHLTKRRVPQCDWTNKGGGGANLPQHSATMNSISGDSNGHQKGSLRCKIRRDVAPSTAATVARLYPPTPPPSGPAVPRWGQISGGHITLFTLHPEWSKRAICELVGESVGGPEPSRPQLSASGRLSAGSPLLLPSWTLISVIKATGVQVRGRRARPEP